MMCEQKSEIEEKVLHLNYCIGPSLIIPSNPFDKALTPSY